jgi:hypothetical protein
MLNLDCDGSGLPQSLQTRPPHRFSVTGSKPIAQFARLAVGLLAIRLKSPRFRVK